MKTKKTILSVLATVMTISIASAVSAPSSLNSSRKDVAKEVEAYQAAKAANVAQESPSVYSQDAARPGATQGDKNISALGKYYVAASADLSLIKFKGDDAKKTWWGYGADLELAANVYKSDCDKYGVDLVAPISYWYGDFSGNPFHSVSFPLYARPYYRIDIEGTTVTPYLLAGAGGLYTHLTTGTDHQEGIDFFWAVGGGIEISFLKDFSITPKYVYTCVEAGSPNKHPNSFNAFENPEHQLSVEFAWKLNKNIALLAGYSYLFWHNGAKDIVKVDQNHRMTLGVRYTF